MKVIFTVDDCFNESAGPSYTVPGMAKAVQACGGEVRFHATGELPPSAQAWTFQASGHPRTFFPWPHLFPSPGMKRALAQDAEWADVAHINTVWRLPSVYAFEACQARGVKTVLSPHGSLSTVALKRSSWKKFLCGFVGVRKMLHTCDMFHAMSLKERDEIRDMGFTQPIAVVPPGIEAADIAKLVGPKKTDPAKRILVFFCRLHPTKVPEHLLEAWGCVADRFPNWEVQFAGPDCGMVAGLERMIAAKSIPRVSFVGEKHGDAKYEFLSKAELYVFPSLTENFGVTVAESLACGTPVITCYGSPWPGLESERCGWWLRPGVDALTEQLEETLAMSPEELKAMGARGQAWMMRDYSWKCIGSRLMASFKWLKDPSSCEKPAWIYV